MSKVRRGSKTETVEHSEAERQVKKQVRYAARLLSLFRLNICSGLWFWPLKDSQPVKICELNVSSDRYKSLDWPAGSTLDMQATVLHESSGPSAFCLSRFTTVERKRTCLVTRAEDCIETANDDEDDDDDDDDDDDKERIKQVFSENISQCETSKDFGAKEAMRKKLTRFARNYKKHRRPKLKDTGAATESVRKSCFNKSTPSLEKRVNELEKELEEKKSTIKNVVSFYNEKLRKIEAENVNLKTELSETQLELLQTQEELGRVNFEKDRLINLEKHNVAFKQIFNLRTEERMFSPDSGQSSCSFSDEGRVAPVEDSPSTDEEPTVNEGASCSNVNASSVQESRVESRDRAGVSLTNIPTTAVERSIYNNYKLLLLTISRLLLASDVSLLKQWAISEFSIQPVSDASEMFTALDRKRIITAVNLDQLRDFFEKIGRIDVVYLIECFLHGDYTYLRNSGVTGFHNISYKNGSTRSITTNYSNNQNSVRIDRNGTVVPLSSANGAQIPTKRTIGHGVSKHGPAHTLKCSAGLPVGCNKWPSLVGNCGAESSQQTVVSPAAGGLVVTDGHGPSNTDTQREAVRGTIQSYSNGSSGNGGKRGYSGLKGDSRGTRVDSGSNGQKLSKFERPATTSNGRPSREEPGDDLGDDEEWLCNHYKRRCYVKFDCCNKYWPCHRCHNNQTKCGQTKLKSRDTKFVKCVRCGKEQQFGANGQYCIQCNAKFSNYFCAICKHLTGKDDHPYHCDKCGICRIHGDRSFHCDVCGVCLDVQLRGNHKCRAGSAHDECCICLEDAFTGCQILPCSHKVHKECATQMIRSGITRCPICRESFAHKLERRTQSAKKPTGKN